MEQNKTQQYEDLLVKNGLKRTGARLQVLDILSHRESATSQPYLENVVGKEIDRVTLYRILKTFEEKGIIHRVLDNHGTAMMSMYTSIVITVCAFIAWMM
jgi:Fur family ferric uptake transcriptional regulator